MHWTLIRSGVDPEGLPLFVRINPRRKRALPRDARKYRVIDRAGEFCLVVNEERLCNTTEPEHVHGG